MARRTEKDYYSPCCGAQAQYMGFYRCAGCRRTIELGELVTAEDAKRILAGQETTCDVLF
jgi:hypothetical protein